jgi:hypothetical protein
MKKLGEIAAAAPCHPTNPLWVSLIKIYMSWGFPLTYERGLIGGFNMVQLWKTPEKRHWFPQIWGHRTAWCRGMGMVREFVMERMDQVFVWESSKNMSNDFYMKLP